MWMSIRSPFFCTHSVCVVARRFRGPARSSAKSATRTCSDNTATRVDREWNCRLCRVGWTAEQTPNKRRVEPTRERVPSALGILFQMSKPSVITIGQARIAWNDLCEVYMH